VTDTGVLYVTVVLLLICIIALVVVTR